MITAREASYGLFGAWRLAHLDPRGMDYFDKTVEGFWRSFWAAGLSAPLVILILVLRYANARGDLDPLRFVLVETIGYAIMWTAYPLAAWYLLQALGRSNRYVGYIVAYNWANVIQIAVSVPIAALIATEALPSALLSVVWLGILAALLFYQYFVARIALEVDVAVASGLVFADFVLSMLREAVVQALELPPTVQTTVSFLYS
jgi:hypothetical protein